MADLSEIGAEILRLRRETGLSRGQLAVQADVEISTIIQLETDREQAAPLAAVYRILRALGADLRLMMAGPWHGAGGLSA
jgi:transcriptional regulator with XRE-family HTH domain